MEEHGITGAFLLLLFICCVMGAWDGLKKRNIRLIVHGRYDLNVCWSGLLAQLVGGICALFAFLFGLIIVNGFLEQTNTCHQEVNCILRGAFLPLFTSWVALVLMLLTAGSLGLWLMTSFSQPGPYRRFFFAPGVWYREADLLTDMQVNLENHHSANVDHDTMLWVTNWVRYQLYPPPAFSFGSYTASTHKEWANKLSKKGCIQQGFDGNKTTLRRVIQLTIEYYAQKNEEANHVWPWRKHLGW